jgi:hypothetical protein
MLSPIPLILGRISSTAAILISLNNTMGAAMNVIVALFVFILAFVRIL